MQEENEQPVPPLHEILNGYTERIETLTGIIETQRLLIEDLYAHVFTDGDALEEHAAQLRALPTSGDAGDVDPRMLAARGAAREKQFDRLMASAVRRVRTRNP